MNSELLNLFVLTFLPGLFSYWYLSQLGIVSHTTHSDKIIFLSSISLLNIAICIFFVYPLVELEINYWIKWVLIALISSMLTFLLSWKVYPWIINIVQKNIDKKLEELGRPKIINERVLKRTLDTKPKQTKNIFFYIFDLQNNFIESGYLAKFNANYGEYNLSNDINYSSYENRFTIEDVVKYYNDSKNKDIFIDLERSVKIYIFYY